MVAFPVLKQILAQDAGTDIMGGARMAEEKKKRRYLLRCLWAKARMTMAAQQAAMLPTMNSIMMGITLKKIRIQSETIS
jgi:Cft2 family RNA processing exonuclease